MRTPRRQSAVTTVTFALLAPILLLVIFGTMEGGRVLSAWLVITNEAREAARYGAVRYGSAPDATLAGQVAAYAQARAQAVLPAGGFYQAHEVAITGDPNRRVDVTLHYRVTLVIPVVSQVLPNPFPLAARSSMRGE